MYIHNEIKINFIHQGYLKNYPYHMISDEEMFNAFILDKENGFFYEYYPMIDESFEAEYSALISSIVFHLNNYLDKDVEIPDWVYSYMLGNVISVKSDPYDIDYLYKMFNMNQSTSNYGVFSKELAMNCLRESKEWVNKLPYSDRYTIIDGERFDLRPPTIFGESNVEKSLRLKQIQL